MTVAELRKKLEGLPDNLPVVKDATDHEYSHLEFAEKRTALRDEDGTLTEDYEQGDLGEETDYGKRVEVFYLGA